MGEFMKRKLFCEISPLAYEISSIKEHTIRHIKNFFSGKKFAKERINEKLPILVYNHTSLIRRKLNNVDLQLQENKAKNLGLATPKVNGILIKPGETFSFWKLVGKCKEKYGYLPGLTITNGTVSSGTAGGMCQFTNLIHWMVLHTELKIVEHHHHNGLDLFPDFGRQVPFGTGTSIVYNTLDYQFTNNTDSTFQIIVYTDDEYLCGEIRTDKEPKVSFHIYEDEAYFEKIGEDYFRHNKIYRKCNDVITGNELSNELICENNAKVAYDPSFIDPEKIKHKDEIKI
jgi:vancomycin resistance protein VanW